MTMNEAREIEAGYPSGTAVATGIDLRKPETARAWLIEAARWLLVLPAATGAMVGTLLVLLVFKFLGAFGIPDVLVEGWMRLLFVTGGTYLFIAAGAYTAPRKKVATAVVLAGVQIAASAWSAHETWRVAGFHLTEKLSREMPAGLDTVRDYVWWDYLSCVITVLTAVLAALSLRGSDVAE
jgi:hypothetical protein